MISLQLTHICRKSKSAGLPYRDQLTQKSIGIGIEKEVEVERAKKDGNSAEAVGKASAESCDGNESVPVPASVTQEDDVEDIDNMDFDVTQWENTQWGKHRKKNHHDSREDCGEGEDRPSAEANLPKDVPGEALDPKAEKGSYLMKPAHISVIIDNLELAAAVTAIIILLFTIKSRNWNVLYPLCNTVFSCGFIVWLIFTHSMHLHVKSERNFQGITEYHIPTQKKWMFLYGHVARCIFSLASASQAIYFAVKSTNPVLFSLVTTMLIIHFFCAAIHLYFALRNRFTLSLDGN